MDLMESGALRLDGLRMLILDEADEMLDMGFLEDIERIAEAMPETKQTLFFFRYHVSGNQPSGEQVHEGAHPDFH